jgi:hypothetical protein
MKIKFSLGQEGQTYQYNARTRCHGSQGRRQQFVFVDIPTLWTIYALEKQETPQRMFVAYNNHDYLCPDVCTYPWLVRYHSILLASSP